MLNWILALIAFLPSFAHAAVFDAADILPAGSGSLGGFGEVLLSDPSSEGVEFRGRYGLTDDWNISANFGFGTKSKQFRMGGEAVYNFIPDYQGQIGVSALGSATFLRSYGVGGAQFRLGPMIHKKILTWNNMDANLFLALPFYFDARAGNYDFGSQIALGSLWDLNDAHRTYLSTELGIRLARADSYFVVGVGFRFGALKFQKRQRGTPGEYPEHYERGRGKVDYGSPSSSSPSNSSDDSNDGPDFRDSDFKK